MTEPHDPTPYDPANVFARILRGEIPNRTVLETAHTLVFHDVNPQAPVHLLAIPKGDYATFDDFAGRASEAEVMDFHRACARVIADLGLAAPGYRVISNARAHGLQEVPHYHLHILGGRPMGRMVDRG